MRTDQMVVSLAFALVIVGYLLFIESYSLRYALLAPVIFIISIWIFEAVGRTRHYLKKRGRYGQTCPDCGGYVKRQPEDYILTCYRCGWKQGIPLIRWAINSVASKQVRRTVSLQGGVVIIICIFMIWASPIISGLSATEAVSDEYERDEVRQEFQHLLNEERESRGLQTLEQRQALNSMGQSHANNMAENEYMGHVQPDGDTIEDRYRSRNLLPECELPIDGTDQYYPGAENAYQGYVDTEIRREYASDLYVGDERDLAQAMFESWMKSKPHREAMLVSSADEMGLGVAVTDQNKAYTALELC